MKKILIVLLMLISLCLVGCNKLNIIGEDEVFINDTIQLTHNFKGDSSEIWTSSDPDIAIVEEGLVYGVSDGVVTITLEIGEHTATKIITVIFPPFDITIKGDNVVYIGNTTKFNAIIPEEFQKFGKGTWHCENNNLASIDQNGIVTGIKEGETKIIYEFLGKYFETSIRIEKSKPQSVKFENVESSINVGKQIKLNVVFTPVDSYCDYYFESSDSSIAYVDENDNVVALKEGEVTITLYLKTENPELSQITTSKTFNIIGGLPEDLEIDLVDNLKVGDSLILKTNIIGDGASSKLIWSTSDPTVAAIYEGILVCLKAGTVTIKATSAVTSDVNDSIDITIEGKKKYSYSQEDIDKVNKIIENMTLSQKIGQMFVVGFNGTSYNSELENAIKNYNFGNLIYMGANVTSPNTLREMSYTIQTKMKEINGVPAFISIDQEGGRVVRIKNGGTHFISNMGMAATNDFNNTYLEGIAMGRELSYYGINTNFAPVCDVNNNRDNPVIGMRSYAKYSVLVSQYSQNMYEGLKEKGIMATVKHFPGHGNTNVDSHYGLPVINSSLESLYNTELIPFINAINNGVDCIMTAHIIFSALDSENPSTLSYKVITEFLRNQLGYEGLVATDGMEMQAITKHYGNYAETAKKAVKAGVDMLLYTSNYNPRSAHSALVDAVNSGEISLERIEESVRRILLTKLKYGILEDFNFNDENINDILEENAKLNASFSEQSITLYQGKYDVFDKNKKTLILSPTCTQDLGAGLTHNSSANYLRNYLKNNGFTNVDYEIITERVDYSIINKIKEYDQIIFIENSPSSYDDYYSYLNELVNLGKNYLVVGYDYPFNILNSNNNYSSLNLKNYVLIYGLQKETLDALGKYVLGEIDANGVFLG